MISYLLSATAIWAASLILYHLVFRKLIHHRENRQYLIISLLTGALLPLVSIPLFQSGPATVIAEPVVQTVQLREEIVQSITAAPVAETIEINWWLIIHIAGVVTSLVVIAKEAFGIYSYYRTGSRKEHNGFTIVYTNGQHSPFSFFNLVFIPQSADYSASELSMILRHETQHSRLRHSLDVLLLLTVRAVFWFHPLPYLYWHYMRLVHEYQADAAEKDNIKGYGHFLLEQQMLHTAPAFTHALFRSPIKNRITMLIKTTSARSARLRYAAALILVPVFTICCAQAMPKGERTKKGNVTIYKNADITWDGGESDTMIIEDPVTKERHYRVVTKDPYPQSVNGKSVQEEETWSRAPIFKGGVDNAAVLIFNRLKPMLDKLPNGEYAIMIDKPIIDDQGKIVYYETSGIAPSRFKINFNDEGEEAGLSFEISTADGTKKLVKKDEPAIPVALKTEIDNALFSLLEGAISYEPARISGENTAAFVYNDLDLMLNRVIIVKDGKATLSVGKRGSIHGR